MALQRIMNCRRKAQARAETLTQTKQVRQSKQGIAMMKLSKTLIIPLVTVLLSVFAVSGGTFYDTHDTLVAKRGKEKNAIKEKRRVDRLIDKLQRLLRSKNRVESIMLGDPGVDQLLYMMKEDNRTLKVLAIRCLESFEEPRVINAMISTLSDNDRRVLQAARSILLTVK